MIIYLVNLDKILLKLYLKTNQKYKHYFKIKADKPIEFIIKASTITVKKQVKKHAIFKYRLKTSQSLKSQNKLTKKVNSNFL